MDGGKGFLWMGLMVGADAGCLLFFVLVLWRWIVDPFFIVLEFPPLWGVFRCVWGGEVGRFFALLIVMGFVPVLQVELELMTGAGVSEVLLLWVVLLPLVLLGLFENFIGLL